MAKAGDVFLIAMELCGKRDGSGDLSSGRIASYKAAAPGALSVAWRELLFLTATEDSRSELKSLDEELSLPDYEAISILPCYLAGVFLTTDGDFEAAERYFAEYREKKGKILRKGLEIADKTGAMAGLLGRC